VHRQTLTFVLRVVRTREELLAACRVRSKSYGHHMPHLRDALLEPDSIDTAESTINVLCLDKGSGLPIGTARFQTSESGPLLIEASAKVPAHMERDTRAEITRLSAVPGADKLVKVCLMKASYLFCVASQIRWMVIGARSQALERQYKRIGFHNLLDEDRTVPLAHAGGVQHRVMAFNVSTTERTWRESHHPLYPFFFDTFHPDIQMFAVDRQHLGSGANVACDAVASPASHSMTSIECVGSAVP